MTRMLALCVRQPYAELIARGVKTWEIRTWRYDPAPRPLLIVASKSWSPGRRDVMDRYGLRDEDCPRSVTVCTVDVLSYRNTGFGYARKALCEVDDSTIAWILARPRRVKPQPVRGRLMLFEVELEEGSIDAPTNP